MPELKLRLHDTLTAKVTPLVPRHAGEVRVYCCGPTVYDVAHIGHARAALLPDILVRHLRGQGLKVTFVRNITDVDDKILKRAAETGEEPTALSARMAKLYQEDVTALGCLEPEVQPKVSESIGDITALVQELIDKGAAYVVDMPKGARDVYYSVRSFPSYGKLSKRNVEELRVGAPLDFALWKGCTPDEWGWDSPWGKGRPGWHIECSAMSSRYLGHGFDVHTGGMDLIFPHHENEIAQSEAAHPNEGPFVSLWIHNGFVSVDKEKMSKSLGNFVTIRQVYERNDPEALRYFLLTVHYRGPINFDVESHCTACGALRDAPSPSDPCTACGAPGPGRVRFPGILEAERRVDYLYQALARLTLMAGSGAPDSTVPSTMPKGLASFVKLAVDARARVDAALDDDLNTPVALAVLGELGKAANELCDLAQKRRKDAEFTRAAPFVASRLVSALRSATIPLGLLQTPPEVYKARTQAQRLAQLGKTPEQIEERIAARTAARQAKNFAESDAIRAELSALNIEVADSPEGSTWRVGL